ncbi:unnamed protein product [Coffea canephora]|uniref:Helicase ATP-binding domain-containing protein n=1 Tax=Coffea canephora TaxID=49390 RepID=A0A068TLA1_COFCA|nr:unnamed protein product [Coffea canephora]
MGSTTVGWQRGERMPVSRKRFLPYGPSDINLKTQKRMKIGGMKSGSACWREELDVKKQKLSAKVIDYSDPFTTSSVLEELGSGKYGSVTKDMEDLICRRRLLLGIYCAVDPTLANLDLENYSSEKPFETKGSTSVDVIDVEDDCDASTVAPLQSVPGVQHLPLAGPLVILDSDDEDLRNEGSAYPYQEIVLPDPGRNLLLKDFENQRSRAGVVSSISQMEDKNDKGVYVGLEDDMDDNEHSSANDDGLDDIWKEMTFAMESSKETAVEPSCDELAAEDADECDHSFILKDDIGYVCRVCGIIKRSIETIIEYQYAKARSTRTYRYEGRSAKDPDQTEYTPGGVKLCAHDFTAAEISAHPRHRKQMKPHQIEGFNFLLSNLMTDNPGGCIMAHAPGSGKTFMIISFLQSFMAKYPFSRPLVVLPRGILATWKKEFQRWQVEDIPLFDFYSVKADSRTQQLEVLRKWAEEMSILFLGYKQFSSIVCDTNCSKAAASCQEILLTCPSILILDEGHTPRNQDTDVLTSLEKVQTPRKIVLSGTLYQNHVKEVFTILNLVRPKFLRLGTSKGIKRRILSRVSISSRRDILRKGSDNEFYEVVEHTLLKDKDFKRKVTVIQDLREMTSKVLHYYKGDFLDELPGLVDFTLLLKLCPKQQKEVAELKKLSRKFKISSEGSALYVHPQLKCLSKNSVVKDRVDEEKIDMILEKLEERDGVKTKFYLNLLQLCESSGEKLLVFSQFLLPLKFLERLTVKAKGYSVGKEIFMITGDSDNDTREISMERFNTSSDARVFFGSIRACGEGISLVGASRIIILDVHLNPSVTRQAIGRAFRPGQERKVYVYRLVASGSPEEEDHSTCFRKESIAKMWFEWNEFYGHHDFEMEAVDVRDCGDLFLEAPRLREDLISVYKR